MATTAPAVRTRPESAGKIGSGTLYRGGFGMWSWVAHRISGVGIFFFLLVHVLDTAIPHLTADDLPTRLVRDIQVRTIRATARAATYEEDGTPWDYDWDRAAVAAWLNGLADNIEAGSA